MSPNPRDEARAHEGFPRVSGDEPAYTIGERSVAEFSPRERG